MPLAPTLHIPPYSVSSTARCLFPRAYRCQGAPVVRCTQLLSEPTPHGYWSRDTRAAHSQRSAEHRAGGGTYPPRAPGVMNVLCAVRAACAARITRWQKSDVADNPDLWSGFYKKTLAERQDQVLCTCSCMSIQDQVLCTCSYMSIQDQVLCTCSYMSIQDQVLCTYSYMSIQDQVLCTCLYMSIQDQVLCTCLYMSIQDPGRPLLRCRIARIYMHTCMVA